MVSKIPRSRIWLWAFFLIIVIAVLAIFIVLSSKQPHTLISTTSSEPTPVVPSDDEMLAPVVAEVQPPAVESGVIAGTVRWFDSDEPARDVPVFAEATGAPTLQTISDADGAYVFDGVLKGVLYTLRAYGGDGGPFAFDERQFQIAAGALLDDQDLVVWPGMTVPGIVYQTGPNTDLSGGATLSENDAEKIFSGDNPFRELKRPFPGVHIRLTRRAPSTDPDLARADAPVKAVHANYDPVSSAARREWEAVTDQAGQFAIPNVPTGQYDIEALTPPSAVALPPNAEATRNDFKIWPGRPDGKLEFSFRVDGLSAEGRVVDAQNKPIEGTFVRATPRAYEEGGTADAVGTVETITDANGRYRLDGLVAADITAAIQYVYGGTLRPQQAYTVTVTAEGFAPRQMEFPALNASLIEAARTALRVGARKGLTDNNEHRRQSELPQSHGRVIELPDMVLEAAATIEGRLVDTTGRTIENALMWPLYVSRPPAMPLEPAPTNLNPLETDANGEFRLHSLPSGGYEFSVTDPETGVIEPPFSPPLHVAAGETLKNARVVIQAKENRGAIRGRVVDARTKKPIEKFETQVSLRARALDERNGTSGNRSEDDMELGRFLIQRISPGRVELRVSADGFPSRRINLEVRAGHETDVVVEMQEGATIEGMVTREGKPLIGAYLTMRAVDKEIRHDDHGTSSDEKGMYRLENLEPLEYWVSVRYEGTTGAIRLQTAKVRVDTGEHARVDFHAIGGSRIQGTFTLPDTFDRAFVYVQVGSGSESLMVDGDFVGDPSALVAFGQRSPSGAYEIGDMPPGDYTVVGVGIRSKIDPNGTTIGKEYIETRTPISVHAGETAHADLTIPSDGR